VGTGYNVQSTSTVALTTGSKTWTVINTATYINNLWKSYSVDNYVYMTPTDGSVGEIAFGIITAISTTTPSVTIRVDQVPLNTGTTRSVWQMSVAGLVGLTGPSGTQGIGYNYTTSTSTLSMVLGEQRFTTIPGLIGQDAFGVGDKIRLISTDAPAGNYYFLAGYLAAKTGTDCTINVDTVQPATSPGGPYSKWRMALTGDATTVTSQAIVFSNTGSATSTNTGALVVTGGVGIGGSAFIGKWLVPMSMSSSTAKSYTGTPTGAHIFLTGAGYNKPHTMMELNGICQTVTLYIKHQACSYTVNMLLLRYRNSYDNILTFRHTW
jgi:hypothetical protein